jgi:hypothetical protein
MTSDTSTRRQIRRRARLLILALACAACTGQTEVARGEDCGQRVRPIETAKMTELRVPGAIVTVDAPGGCRWIEALGVQDVTKPLL